MERCSLNAPKYIIESVGKLANIFFKGETLFSLDHRLVEAKYHQDIDVKQNFFL